MKEEEGNWLRKWEDELPSPEELMPLSQSLITPPLASAFDIRGGPGNTLFPHQHHSSSSPQLLHPHNYGGRQQQNCSSAPHLQPNSSEFDSSSAELGGGSGGGGGGADEPARTLKRPRLVWTPQLHKRFVDTVAHLGIKNAVPKTIMQLMSVDGLTRENVASHLQKYRLYLKRMQGLNNGGGNGPGSGLSGSGDPGTDHLFASSPVPAHFLHQPTGGSGNGGARPNSDHFMPYMGVAALHHPQTAAAVAGHQAQYRQMGQFGSAQGGGGGQFDHSYQSRQAQLGPDRNGMLQSSGYVESGTANHGRKVLTLFPTGDD